MADESAMGAADLDHERQTGAFAPRPGRRVRIVREPLLSVGDVVAGLVMLIMVGGPLALGALGY